MQGHLGPLLCLLVEAIASGIVSETQAIKLTTLLHICPDKASSQKILFFDPICM